MGFVISDLYFPSSHRPPDNFSKSVLTLPYWFEILILKLLFTKQFFH